MSVKWRDIRDAEKDFHWEISWGLNEADLKTNNFTWKEKNRKPANTSKFVMTVDGYSNSQGGRKYGSKASAWIGRKLDLLDEENSFKAIGNLYGRPNEKGQLHEQVMLAAEYFGCQVWYEHNADDYDSYFRERGRVLYLGIYPLSTIPPEDRGKAERHRGFPTTPTSLTRQTDVGISYFENHCHRIDFPDLFPHSKKFDPYNRTKFDMVVSFMMLIVCMMEKSEEQEKRKQPIIQTYGQPQLSAA